MDVVAEILQRHQDLYQRSIEHPLTNDLCNGTLSDERLFVYLVQDSKYFEWGLNLFGKTLSLCDQHAAAVVIGKQIGFISNDENDYFDKTLAELKSLESVQKAVPSMLDTTSAPTLAAVAAYLEYMKYLVFECNSYIELVTVLYVMEQVYLGWADLNLQKERVPKDLSYKYNEWIVLHSGEKFTQWVAFLRSEINRTVKTQADFLLSEETFIKVIDLEIGFFNACYVHKE